MKLHLNQYETGSVITLEYQGKFGRFASLIYTNRAHKYSAEADFKRLSTELQTYGETAMLEEYTRLQDGKLNELRESLRKGGTA